MNKKFELHVKYQGQREMWESKEDAAYWHTYSKDEWKTKEEAIEWLEEYLTDFLDWQVHEVYHSDIIVAKKGMDNG